MATTTSIPIIDFAQVSNSPDSVARELLQACADWGFFYVKNHPIPPEHISAIFSLSQIFFAQPNSVKLLAPYNPAHNAGFKPAHSHSSAGSSKKPDPREAVSINKWPTLTSSESAVLPPILSDNRPLIRSFQAELHAFALSLLECIALALDLPPSTFTAQHEHSQPNFDNFELMHYPALPPSTPAPHNRISPHTDWGSITLLFQHDIGGLQVRPPKYTSPTLADDEEWTPAPVLTNSILVNIGDMMEFWTAGRLKSTWHRVTSNVVSHPEHGYLDRYCVAYFLHPNKDAVLVPMEGMCRGSGGWRPRYEGQGRTAEQHIRARISGVHGVVKDEAGEGMNGKRNVKVVEVR